MQVYGFRLRNNAHLDRAHAEVCAHASGMGCEGIIEDRHAPPGGCCRQCRTPSGLVSQVARRLLRLAVVLALRNQFVPSVAGKQNGFAPIAFVTEKGEQGVAAQ